MIQTAYHEIQPMIVYIIGVDAYLVKYIFVYYYYWKIHFTYVNFRLIIWLWRQEVQDINDLICMIPDVYAQKVPKGNFVKLLAGFSKVEFTTAEGITTIKMNHLALLGLLLRFLDKMVTSASRLRQTSLKLFFFTGILWKLLVWHMKSSQRKHALCQVKSLTLKVSNTLLNTLSFDLLDLERSEKL